MMIDLKPEVIKDLQLLLTALTNAFEEHQVDGPNPHMSIMYDTIETQNMDPLNFFSFDAHTLELAKNLKRKLHM